MDATAAGATPRLLQALGKYRYMVYKAAPEGASLLLTLRLSSLHGHPLRLARAYRPIGAKDIRLRPYVFSPVGSLSVRTSTGFGRISSEPRAGTAILLVWLVESVLRLGASSGLASGFFQPLA